MCIVGKYLITGYSVLKWLFLSDFYYILEFVALIGRVYIYTWSEWRQSLFIFLQIHKSFPFSHIDAVNSANSNSNMNHILVPFIQIWISIRFDIFLFTVRSFASSVDTFPFSLLLFSICILYSLLTGGSKPIGKAVGFLFFSSKTEFIPYTRNMIMCISNPLQFNCVTQTIYWDWCLSTNQSSSSNSNTKTRAWIMWIKEISTFQNAILRRENI